MTASILIAIADSGERENWKRLLENHGYLVVAIATGEHVPDLCAHLRPDLVILEADLLDVSGLEICRRLKDDPRNKLTPVILIEGLSGDPGLSPMRGAEADDVWGPRPTRWEALTRIQSILQLKTYIDEQAQAVVLSLACSIEARDSYTRGHSERLAETAAQLGRKVGLSSEMIETLRIAGIVHDVGKVAVPDSVLLKPGPLNPQETAIMRASHRRGAHLFPIEIASPRAAHYSPSS